MNWFKKRMSKLFNSEIDEDEYYDEIGFDEEQESPGNRAQEMDGNIESHKKSFKFPLIADEEMGLTREASRRDYAEQEGQAASFEHKRTESIHFYQKNAISKVYDVEVSGIHELLERRQRNKGKTTTYSTREDFAQRRRKDQENPQEPTRQTLKKSINTPLMNKAEEHVPTPKRRFVPTEVPSPVYGFKKPSDIDHLLAKKQQEPGKDSEKEKDDSILQQASPELRENKTEAVYAEVPKFKDETASMMEPTERPGNQEQQTSNSHAALNTAVMETKKEPEQMPSEFKELSSEKSEIPAFEEAAPVLAVQMEEEPHQEKAFNDEGQELKQAMLETDREPGQAVEADIPPCEIEGIPFMEEAAAIEAIQTDSEREQGEISGTMDSSPEEYLNDSISGQPEDNAGNPAPIMDTEDLALIESEQVRKVVSIAISDQDEDAMPLGEKQVGQEQLQDIKTEDRQQKSSSKGSTLPFNVLMLKSDKEKYAAKLAQKQLLQHNDGIKEITRQPTSTGNYSNVGEMQKLQQVSAPSATAVLEPAAKDPAIEQEQGYAMQEDVQDAEEFERPDEKPAPEEFMEEAVQELAACDTFEQETLKIYTKPSLDFLSPPEEKTEDREWLESQGDVLVESLSYFQVTAQVESITQGPAVTQFEITVSHGTKVSKIRNLADDLKLALAAKDIRIQAPIPGKSTIGIEIPNRISSAVRLSEVTCSDSFKESESPMEAALGLDLTGKPVTIDLRKMPHGLIAGATGSGKSVCINSILVSLLYKANPNELKLMLIDPKMVELAPFNHIPHLVSPVITDVKAATAALKWAVEEMERRYQLFAHAGVRDLTRFNKLAESKGEYGHKLPYMLIVIDELADLMMMSPADVEEAICRIAQKARACGIHLIVATQRPSVDVITGLIKSNIPTRIAFAVSSQVDSRTILDSQGAERLLGRGDMLYLGNGMSAPIRLQGTFVTDDEIESIIDHVRAQGEPDYIFEQDELLKKAEMVEEQDELFEEVCRFVFEQGSASTSSIQRKYHIGYNRAARLMDMLESQGFISEQRGSKPREVFITDSDLSNMFE